VTDPTGHHACRLTLQRRADVLWRVAGSTVVLLPPGARDPLVLEGSGRSLWEALADPLPPDEVVHTLADRYGVDVDTMRADVDRAITELSAQGLLREGV
jgi:hypothetical protein